MTSAIITSSSRRCRRVDLRGNGARARQDRSTENVRLALPRELDPVYTPRAMAGKPHKLDGLGFPVRAACLAAVWWVLAEGDPSSWWFGVPFVLGAAWWARGAAAPEAAWSPLGTLRFAGFFARSSILSGLDVAARTLRPDMGLQPGFVRYPLGLPPGISRYLFIHAITLMPGTLSVDREGGDLVVHVLDVRSPYLGGLQRLERTVGGIFRARAGPTLQGEEDG